MALTAAQRTAVSKIAGLTIVNAMVFQEMLSVYDARVEPLRKTLDSSDPLTALCTHWQHILDHIDYVPIFRVARELLLVLPTTLDTEQAIRFLGQRALDIVRWRAALRHDLMGRVYHRLLAEAKYLGTYYTSVPAATMLLKLALSHSAWAVPWSSLDEISQLRIGDLACGTGTLLMAAAEALTDNYVRACAALGMHPDLKALHCALVEQVIYGYDVLPSAIHLTASTLALRSADVAFGVTNLYSLPLGGPHHRLGSIDFLRGREVPVLLDFWSGATSAGQVTGGGDVTQQPAVLPDLDLCVMNPPFVRSVGGNLLFGSVPAAERKPMQSELARLLRNPNILASSTAGLGSVFVAVGDRALKAGGRMALVLPKAVLSGVAWAETRRLFQRSYQLEYMVASHDPGRWNFSENTSLSEVLLVAKKTEPGEWDPDKPVVAVNLWRNPSTVFAALNVAQTLLRSTPPDLEQGQGAADVLIGTSKAGESISVPWGELAGREWILPCAFAQSELTRAAYHLQRGSLYLPGVGVARAVPLRRLGQLGQLGPDRRDIHDGFALANAPTAYPALWGHEAGEAITLARIPNRYLAPLPQAKPGRPLRRAQDLWPRSGRIALAERLRLNTQRTIAVRLSERILSNVWWPFHLASADEAAEKALVVWLNSTLGLLHLLATREETEGAWIDFKKPTLESALVLSVDSLTMAQKAVLVACFDTVADMELQPFPEMADDPVRQQIDDALVHALELPDVGILRRLLAQEPVVCNRALI